MHACRKYFDTTMQQELIVVDISNNFYKGGYNKSGLLQTARICTWSSTVTTVKTDKSNCIAKRCKAADCT